MPSELVLDRGRVIGSTIKGYDNTPVSRLEADMAAFVDQLIERDLRYTEDMERPARAVLEWFVDGERSV